VKTKPTHRSSTKNQQRLAVHLIRIRSTRLFLLHTKPDTPPQQAKMSLRSLRACMVCSIVQAGTKFVSSGCPNCDEFLEMRHSADVVQDCTSAVFEGMISMADPATSWVAKWQRLEGYAPGTYAVKVEGVVSLLEDIMLCDVLTSRSFRMITSLPQRTLA
jgi:transcription elongation factor SPT4